MGPLQLGQEAQTPLQPRALWGGSSRPLGYLHLCAPCWVGQTWVAPGDHSPRAALPSKAPRALWGAPCALQIFVRSWKKQQRGLGVTAWPPSSAGKLQLLPQGLTCPPAASTITNNKAFFSAYIFLHPTTAKGEHQRLPLCPWVLSEQFYGEALTASSDKTPNPVLTACPCLWGCCQVRRDFPLFPCPSQPILPEQGPGAAVPQLPGTPLPREVTPELLEPCQALTGRFALLLLQRSFTNQFTLNNSQPTPKQPRNLTKSYQQASAGSHPLGPWFWGVSSAGRGHWRNTKGCPEKRGFSPSPVLLQHPLNSLHCCPGPQLLSWEECCKQVFFPSCFVFKWLIETCCKNLHGQGGEGFTTL